MCVFNKEQFWEYYLMFSSESAVVGQTFSNVSDAITIVCLLHKKQHCSDTNVGNTLQ